MRFQGQFLYCLNPYFSLVQQYWTLDDAEAARADKQSPSLDEDALGHLETDIRALGVMLRKADKMVS